MPSKPKPADPDSLPPIEEDETDRLMRLEREKMTTRWTRDAPAVLQGAYRLMVGMTPPKSWSFAMTKGAAKLSDMELAGGEEAVMRFLRESMTAFILRCGGAYQKEPTSPFFADSYVFSNSALEYLNNHSQRVRKYSWMAADPESFPRKVYELFFASECEYWTLGMPNTPPLLELMRPDVYWVIFSASCGRLCWERGNGMYHLDRFWPEWDHEVDYMGAYQPLQTAVQKERQRLKGDNNLLLTAMMAAGEAIWDASLATWQRLGLGRLSTDDAGRVVIPGDGKELWPFKYNIEGEQTLWEWELSWRGFLSGKMGLEYDADQFQTTCKAVSPATPRRRGATLTDLIGTDHLRHPVDPFIMAAIEDGTK